MTTLDSALLGLIQGVTEFLPVSSSGHLILLRDLLGINTETGLAFDAVLQLGTILAVFVYFWKDIWKILQNLVKILTGNKQLVAQNEQTLIGALIVGTIPAMILGLLLEKTMETTFRSAPLIALTLILGSILMAAAEWFHKKTSTTDTPDLKKGFWIGLFQSLALVPGVSRSGATISGGLFLGLTRAAATRFSFLLALPIITGSGLFKLIKIAKEQNLDFDALQLAIGFGISFIVGYICIRWLIKYLANHSLMAFVYYRLALAVVVLVAMFAK
jgi:undecaprenyl-diphosphatase